MTAPVPGDDQLRLLVRELLREVVPSVLGDVTGSAGAPPGHGTAEAVRVGTDAELERFVRRLLVLFDDPAERAALRDGRRRFTLAAPPAPGPTDSAGSRPQPHRITAAAVTERQVDAAARAGATVLLLPHRAVLTPLARDRIRALGLTVERES